MEADNRDCAWCNRTITKCDDCGDRHCIACDPHCIACDPHCGKDCQATCALGDVSPDYWPRLLRHMGTMAPVVEPDSPDPEPEW